MFIILVLLSHKSLGSNTSRIKQTKIHAKVAKILTPTHRLCHSPKPISTSYKYPHHPHPLTILKQEVISFKNSSMANSSLLSLSLCLLVLCHCSSAVRDQSRPQQGQQQYRQSKCRLQNLNPLEPNQSIQHEAGVTELWDQNNEQLGCVGVAATRHVIEQQGLLLPSFNNAPMLVYVVQGRGILGTMFPGCPETYQSLQHQREGGRQAGQRSMDEHQKIRFIRQGDIIALPTGIAHWSYNDGETQLVLVVVHDTNNHANQLDQNLRRFFLAGNPEERQTRSYRGQEQLGEELAGNNILQALDTEILAEAFGVSQETARKLQNENDWRGNIVRVENRLKVTRPRMSDIEEEQMERGSEWRSNGLEETICSMKLRENIDDMERADVYSARGGRIRTLNSHNLPILKNLQLSAQRGVLYKNAMVSPHWNLNAHSVIYIIRGSGRIQIVGNSKRPAFDGEVQQGQLLVVPQNFVVVKQAGSQGLEWVAIRTNDVATMSPIAGKTSVIRAMPEEVLMSSYQLSREEARSLKYNREEVTILSPRSMTSRGRASASNPSIN